MSIEVKMDYPNCSLPIEVILNGESQFFTKKAALELKNKIEAVLEDLIIHESEKRMRG